MSTTQDEAVESIMHMRALNIQQLVKQGGCPSVAAAQRSEGQVWKDVAQRHGGFHVHAYVTHMYRLHGSWSKEGSRTKPIFKTLKEVVAMTDMSDTLDTKTRAKHQVNNVCPKCKKKTLEFHTLQQARGDELSEAYDICSDATCGYRRKASS